MGWQPMPRYESALRCSHTASIFSSSAAIEKENLSRIRLRRAIFLINLKSIDFSLHIASAIEVELVPARLKRVVDLGCGFGDEDEPIRVKLRDARGDDSLP